MGYLLDRQGEHAATNEQAYMHAHALENVGQNGLSIAMV